MSEARKITLQSENGRALDFDVIGRTTAERQFKLEDALCKTQGPKDLVPFEILFHPFWPCYGHTSIRIGNTIHELSAQGWKSHGQGQDNARAYLFNNPFFKRQARKFKRMPPLSLGVTLMVEKEKLAAVEALVREKVLEGGPAREKFHIFYNNCNQGVMRVLGAAQIPGFTKSGFLGFSSILSFRQTLLSPRLPQVSLQIYPLPANFLSHEELTGYVPKLLYARHTYRSELQRILLAWAADSYHFCRRKTLEVMKSLGAKVESISHFQHIHN